MSDHTELDEARRQTYLVAAQKYAEGQRDERTRIVKVLRRCSLPTGMGGIKNVVPLEKALAEIRAETIADTAYVRISDVVDAIEAKDKTEERMMHDREYHIAMSDAVSVVRQLSTDD